MANVARGDEAPVDLAEVEAGIDVSARKGWDFFTKFLLTNVIVIVVTLLGIGLLTVWR